MNTGTGDVPRRRFGRHPELVSALGLGGFHLGKIGNERDAIKVVHAAIDGGITFLDNAWEYHDGKSEMRMGKAIRDRRDRVFLMTKVCTHGRDARSRCGSSSSLSAGCRRIISISGRSTSARTTTIPSVTSREGASSRRWSAPKQGKVRYVGFTGHKDPEIHLGMLSVDFPFDSCQLPLNGFDATFRSFEQHRAAGARAAAGLRQSA